MSSLYMIVFIAMIGLAVVQGQNVVCPRCTDSYDPNSCNETQVCPNSKDVCELHVHTRYDNRVEYICHNFHACANHEVHACDPQHHEVCAYCCTSFDACMAQLDELFTSIYTTASPPAMTNAPSMPNVDTTPNYTAVDEE